MKVGIIGARSRNEFHDKAKIRTTLLEILQRNIIETIVSGGAKRGDRFAEELAKEFGLPTRIFIPKLIQPLKLSSPQCSNCKTFKHFSCLY